ncbi:MAG TPA: hypothetical protein VMR88_02270, partial [Candidatus Polarisedimenticolaceae bacterium]|nr:hypothetical protein [Candidatus Polarisedimenticolaceae bacterium]
GGTVSFSGALRTDSGSALSGGIGGSGAILTGAIAGSDAGSGAVGKDDSTLPISGVCSEVGGVCGTVPVRQLPTTATIKNKTISK